MQTQSPSNENTKHKTRNKLHNYSAVKQIITKVTKKSQLIIVIIPIIISVTANDKYTINVNVIDIKNT
jgi:hypothetical protein